MLYLDNKAFGKIKCQNKAYRLLEIEGVGQKEVFLYIFILLKPFWKGAYDPASGC